MKKRREPRDDTPSGLTYNPFAALRAALGPDRAQDAAPAAPADGPADGPADSTADSTADGAGEDRPPAVRGRLVVRREKRGRAGKTVTRVEGLGLDGAALQRLAQELKRALGCGASVEGDDVLLQGSQGERAAGWLRERFGVAVTLGN